MAPFEPKVSCDMAIWTIEFSIGTLKPNLSEKSVVMWPSGPTHFYSSARGNSLNFTEGELSGGCFIKRFMFSHENLRGTFAAQGKTLTIRR